MELLDKNSFLQEIPLFANLSKAELRLVKERSLLREYKKGEFVYQEGSPAEAFYAIILGRVLICTYSPQGNQTILEYLHRGKYFGMISLLTKEAHSVTAQAVNDCLLLVIESKDFDYILQKIPSLAIDLSRTLSRRLKRKDIHQKTIFESTIVSAFSSYSQAGKTVYSLNLALSLKKETRKSVIILDIASLDKMHSLPQRLGIGAHKVLNLCEGGFTSPKIIRDFISYSQFGVDLACFYYQSEDDACLKKLIGIFSLLVNDYHYIVLDLPSAMDRVIFNILNQSDLIHILTSPEPVDLKRTRYLLERLRREFNFGEDKIKIIINEYRLSKLTHEKQVGFLGKGVFATLPRIDFNSGDRLILEEPQAEYSKAVRRIARRLGDCEVGLALGVGVAYGFCHLGILKVIEEEKIPVDVIVGSSIGALIASLWVTGKSSDEILEITKEFKEPKHIWGLIDLTFPLLGFIKGNKLHRFLKKHLDNKTFYDIKLPLKIVASDVKRKESKILDKGLLVDAIMASCAMPGVFTPFKFKEEMLFDGGVVNPLPTEPLLKMGVRKIIAVNVTPSREDIMRQYDKMKQNFTVVSSKGIPKKHWFNLKQHIQELFKTNILDIIFSSIELLQSEVAQKEAQLADLVLHPDNSGLFWLELHRAREFAKRGEEEARKNLDKIWQVIQE